MAKLNLNNVTEGKNPAQGVVAHGFLDRVPELIHRGIQDVDVLASAANKINSARNSRKTTDTDNAVRLRKAEIDAKNEENRHNEEMRKIDREWEMISNDAADRERKLSFIQGEVQRFQTEYDKYISMETEDFLNDTVTSRLESLRKVIMELTKELLRV